MKYFTITELTKSSTAAAKGIDNTPSKEIIVNLTTLVDKVLDPLREWYGKPIYVTSGYRCEALNKAVGGVATSYHLKGMAADIDLGDKDDNQPLFDYIKNNLEFTELGWEGNGSWIHVAYDPEKLNKKIFYA